MDDFGDRMKSYEKEFSQILDQSKPMFARVDGRAFHSFTKGFDKPYDSRFVTIMRLVMNDVMVKFHPIAGYTQSDEMTFFWMCQNDNSELPFSGKVAKINSLLASFVSVSFLKHLMQSDLHKHADKMPTFDCRVFQPPKDDITNAFLWRAKDGTRNAIQMIAQHYFSHKELHGKSIKMQLEMLKEKNISMDMFSNEFVYGTYMTKDLVKIDNTDIPEKYRPVSDIFRSKIVAMSVPFPLFKSKIEF